jgi:hypothetical protein
MERGGIFKPIWLPVIVAVIVVPTALGAVFGGPGVGIVIAVVVLVAIVVLAVRSRPKEPIETAPAPDKTTHRVLLALTAPVADRATADKVVRAAEARGNRPTEILALAPTHPHFLGRWASDVREAEVEARQELDVTVASLRREHVDAQTEVGDSDVVLAIEDALREFPADEVVLATGSAEDDPDGTAAARNLAERLQIHFEHVVTSPGADGR